jgi:putative flippase GtrA
MTATTGAVTQWQKLRQLPLVRRFAGYSVGSIIATVTAELAFVIAYAWGHAGPVGASAAGFVGGAVPNYILNRRWAWPDRDGRSRRTEAVLYGLVALASFSASAVATRWAQHWARGLTGDASWRTLVVGAAYLVASGIVFVAKFVLYDRFVFTTAPCDRAADAERSAVATTRS